MVKEKGFTLLELLVVMAIIGILAAIAVPTYKSSMKKAKESVLKQDLFTLRDLLDQYYADKAKYPSSLDDLIAEGYLRVVPKDPMTNENNWITVPYEGPSGGGEGGVTISGENNQVEVGGPEPLTNEETGGIWDVHSASEGIALDGTKYTEW